MAENEGLFNIYVHCRDPRRIQSTWLRRHVIPSAFLQPTSYYHVVPAVMSTLLFAYHSDNKNTWFCFATDSCVPIVSPGQFLRRFQTMSNKTIMGWGRSHWNVQFHTRANLRHLETKYWLYNDPWFTMTRRHVALCLAFPSTCRHTYDVVCRGGLANESIFAVMLAMAGRIANYNREADGVVNASATVADWMVRASATSPRLFIRGDSDELSAIRRLKTGSPHAMFLRKVGQTFPVWRLAEFVGPNMMRSQGLGLGFGFRRGLKNKITHQQEGIEDDVDDITCQWDAIKGEKIR